MGRIVIHVAKSQSYCKTTKSIIYFGGIIVRVNAIDTELIKSSNDYQLV